MRAELARLVGADQVREPEAAWLVDRSTEVSGVRGHADAVVLPRSADEVAAVVAWCYERDVAMVPRGGGTGLAGGAVPVRGGIVISLERMAAVRSFDPLLWRIEVEAGVTTRTVQRLARENGLLFPVDPGGSEQSQIGGNIATNAGGPHTFKHGSMGRWVTGLEAVVAPGEVVRVGGASRKDVAGYDLRSLLVGSEGTLGVVTGAWLRLVPAPPVEVVLAASYPTIADGVAAVERVLGSGVVPSVIEYLDGVALAAAPAGPLDVPEGTAMAVLCEVDTSERDADEVAEALGPSSSRVAGSDVWRWRDGVSIGVDAWRGGRLSEDVAVPLDRLGDAIEGTLEIGRRHGLEACSWGHAGDGNLHATFVFDRSSAPARTAAEAAVEDVFAMAIAMGGTISGEHGIGWLKRGWLSRQWDPAAVRLHEAIKATLDPKGLFNPGKKTA